MTTPDYPITEYQEEFAALKSSFLAAARDLIRDLNATDRPLEAMAIDEAQLYMRAALCNIERTLAKINGKAHS